MKSADAAVGRAHQDLAQLEGLLDRYGLSASDLVDKEGLAGGFSGFSPLLKAMDGMGTIIRGLFVD
ncbi:Lhr family helicase [Bifidobacterium aemilianum]|uniref:Lhr family helicase n=1 Tax=Bifidobacterium aemilianum TaxID=2493120 RepID=UPI000FDD1B87|nr:hypothetical protein [Bifidobacterium aemilianum]